MKPTKLQTQTFLVKFNAHAAFKSDKNPRRAFLERGSKAGGK
jgi:hypothetical protein